MLRKSMLPIAIGLLLVIFFVVGCAGTEEEVVAEKESIVIGAVRSQSGPFAVFEETAFGPIYKMWVEEVNANGGIYVEEYGKKLPIELIVYDDKSDLNTMTRLFEKLILEDKVDFLLPPTSTAFLFAAAPIANKHGYILMGAEGGCTSLKDAIAGMPGFFSVLNFSDHQVPVLADILAEHGIETAFIVFIEDLHGTEYFGQAAPALASKGIEIVAAKSVPPDIKDVTPIINEAAASGADAFLAFVYPDQGFPLVGTSMALGYNPDVFLIGPGGNFEFIKEDVFGSARAVEGLMSWGAWNAKSSPEAAEFVEKFSEKWGKKAIDWWGHLPYYASLQVLQQAIERAGCLDHEVIREIIANEHFDTVMGDTWFEGGLLATDCYEGQVGQWQNGIFEVIGPSDRATAEPIIPKPPWPKPESKS